MKINNNKIRNIEKYNPIKQLLSRVRNTSLDKFIFR